MKDLALGFQAAMTKEMGEGEVEEEGEERGGGGRRRGGGEEEGGKEEGGRRGGSEGRKGKEIHSIILLPIKGYYKKKDINSAFAMLLLNCSESRVRETETVIRMCC